MRYLITGGTGSFGNAFVSHLLATDAEYIAVLSRDELKQSEMARRFPDPRMRFFIGDVRDAKRLHSAMDGIDTVVHAAAMKHVPACEYNPLEAVKTNVMGAANVIEAAIARGVSKVVALSTDKAAAPVNLYGATKMCSDKLFLDADYANGRPDTRFALVRYGNVFGSRGSVVPLFQEQAKTGRITITDTRMTRFSMTMPQAVEMVTTAIRDMTGGEMFVTKAPSYHITDLAAAVAPSASIDITGIRPGEKLHEELITHAEAPKALDMGGYFVVRDGDGSVRRYASDENDCWLTIDDIRRQL